MFLFYFGNFLVALQIVLLRCATKLFTNPFLVRYARPLVLTSVLNPVVTNAGTPPVPVGVPPLPVVKMGAVPPTTASENRGTPPTGRGNEVTSLTVKMGIPLSTVKIGVHPLPVMVMRVPPLA